MKIGINTGVKSIDIERNGEIVGSISFSLSDPALLSRLKEVQNKALEIQQDSRLSELAGETENIEAVLDEAERVDGEIRKTLDWAFGSSVSDVVFGDSFTFTTYEGKTVLEQFLDGVMPLIADAFQSELDQSQKRDNYLKKYKK